MRACADILSALDDPTVDGQPLGGAEMTVGGVDASGGLHGGMMSPMMQQPVAAMP